ncbi:SRPBCC family protein [Kineococcus rubinsiae]|uniref:SRPBCC family protein n=1 Tax=Kineococcus rubinsiae TaxID=2609562 RepID=UPI0014315F75|nr:SRPBCC family protein [Kineococcus rubinsiae]NIZ90210.1 polyketide cyclase [Kineococcus rubinsiae]
MTSATESRIVVEREVAADAATVFGLLADPRRHPEIDGSGTVRVAEETRPIAGAGQSFVMDMDLTAVGHPELSDYQTENHVVEFAPGERLAWATARRGQTPPGVRWSWSLHPAGPGRTRVVHTYDWSAVTDPAVLARISFPRIPADRLAETLVRLAAAVEGR